MSAEMSDGTMAGVGLLLVDIQYDFIDGNLAVKGGGDIIDPVTKLIKGLPWSLIVASQDFHPKDHISFASNHPNGPGALKTVNLPHPNASRAKRGDTITQMVWPDHCIQGTRGAEIHEEISKATDAKARSDKTPCYVVQKGNNPSVDGYSAFADNAYLGFSELPRLLFSAQPEPIHTLVVVGLATDYCVLASALDAVKFNLRTIVPRDAVRGASEDTINDAWQEMQDAGIEVLPATDHGGANALFDQIRATLERR